MFPTHPTNHVRHFPLVSSRFASHSSRSSPFRGFPVKIACALSLRRAYNSTLRCLASKSGSVNLHTLQSKVLRLRILHTRHRIHICNYVRLARNHLDIRRKSYKIQCNHRIHTLQEFRQGQSSYRLSKLE